MTPTEDRRIQSTRVVGLAVRTTNAAEGGPGTARIPALWQRFRDDSWFDRLAAVGASGPPVGVYSGYEAGVSGDFQILAGREVRRDSTDVPSEAQAIDIVAGRFLVFPFIGVLPDIVIAGWQQVWAFFERSHSSKRAYTTDAEFYHPDGQGVDIWIAIE
jgi:predicted transcriptional regulator YdeE